MNKETNYYGNLCTQMYELLHPIADEDELNFYLSYAQENMKILEPMCGSGRFLLPFKQKGFDIEGFDLSKDMVDELLKKDSSITVKTSDIDNYYSNHQYDYIFIASSSFSLFVNEEQINNALLKVKTLLKPNGLFVFGIESIYSDRTEIKEYKERCKGKTSEGYDLVLKTKQHYCSETSVLHMPNLYELYDGSELLQSETMDFQIRLYENTEIDSKLNNMGFEIKNKYANYKNENVANSDLILYVCNLK